jgi:hypothetical protein
LPASTSPDVPDDQCPLGVDQGYLRHRNERAFTEPLAVSPLHGPRRPDAPKGPSGVNPIIEWSSARTTKTGGLGLPATGNPSRLRVGELGYYPVTDAGLPTAINNQQRSPFVVHVPVSAAPSGAASQPASGSGRPGNPERPQAMPEDSALLIVEESGRLKSSQVGTTPPFGRPILGVTSGLRRPTTKGTGVSLPWRTFASLRRSGAMTTVLSTPRSGPSSRLPARTRCHLGHGRPLLGRAVLRGPALQLVLVAAIGATAAVYGVGPSYGATVRSSRPHAAWPRDRAGRSVMGPRENSRSPAAVLASGPLVARGRVGSTLSIDDVAGARAKMTLVKVIDPAKDVDQFIRPTGNRLFVAAMFKIVSTGTYYFPNADTVGLVKFIGSDGRTYANGSGSQLIYNTGNVRIAGCTNFANERAALAPGQSSVGCVVVEVPPGVTVTRVRYSDGGTLGQWTTS